MTAKTITRAQYYQVCGLMLLAQRHAKAMDDITAALREVLSEDDPSGWVSDAVFGSIDDYDPDALLKKMKIQVGDGAES